MKKMMLVILGIITFAYSLTAEIVGSRYKITESENEFDIAYYQTPDMTVIDSKVNNDVDITQSFMIRKNNTEGELRYSLFTDTVGNKDDLKIQYAMWVYICANNIAGFDVANNSFSNFNDNDVKNEFNGDFGCTTFIQNPKSDYGDGYKYMMVEFFHKLDQGLVMRVFLFNSIDFLGMDNDGNILSSSPLFTNYHTFKFMEKNEKGDYILE